MATGTLTVHAFEGVPRQGTTEDVAPANILPEYLWAPLRILLAYEVNRADLRRGRLIAKGRRLSTRNRVNTVVL